MFVLCGTCACVSCWDDQVAYVSSRQRIFLAYYHEVEVAGNVLLLITVHGARYTVSVRLLHHIVPVSVCLSVGLSATAWQVCHFSHYLVGWIFYSEVTHM